MYSSIFKEDNTVYVLQKLIRAYNLKITETSLREFLWAHPNYPSLQSICDTLNKWKINHYSLKLDVNEIKELDVPFIAHFNNSIGLLVYVEKIVNGNVFFSAFKGENKIETFEKFSSQLSGAVIVIETENNVYEEKYKKKRQNEILYNNLLILIGVSMLLLGLLSFSQSYWEGSKIYQLFWELLIAKIIGICISLFLVMHEYNIHIPFADKLCKFSLKTDCDEVLTSGASSLFGWINWSDIGLIYFIGTFIYLLGFASHNLHGLLPVISLVTLPYPIFSIYYQTFKLKKWCPYCLLIQVVLVTEFILIIPLFKTLTFTEVDFIRLISSLFITATLWLIFKAYIEKMIYYRSNQQLFMQIKHNPIVFSTLLKSNSFFDIPENPNSLIIGSDNAQVRITAFLSLKCAHCVEAYKTLISLCENRSEVKIDFVFSITDDIETNKIMEDIYYKYDKEGAKAMLSILNNWYLSPKIKTNRNFDKEITPELISRVKQIQIQNNNLFSQCKIIGTPTIFVNGYQFPQQYELSILEYYIDSIK